MGGDSRLLLRGFLCTEGANWPSTLVSPLHADGSHRRKAEVEDGFALREAEKDKRTCPELCQGNGKARLVVIACEGPPGDKRLLVVQGVVCDEEVVWERAGSMVELACSATKAFVCFLMGVTASPNAGDQIPSVHEVLADARHVV